MGSPATRKPWYRTRNLALLLLLAVTAWLAREVSWAYTATPGNSGRFVEALPAILARFERGSEGENALPLVLQASALLSSVEEEVNAEWTAGHGDPASLGDIGYSLLGGRWGAVDLLRWVDLPDQARAASLETLRRSRAAGLEELLDRVAATTVYERPLPTGAAYAWLLADLTQLRQLARYAAGSFAEAAARGDEAGAIRALRFGLALAEHAYHQPTLIDRMVAIAIEGLMLNTLGETLGPRAWEPDALLAFAALVGRAEREPGFDLALAGERALLGDTVGQMFTDDGAGDGRLIYTQLDAYEQGLFGTPAAARLPRIVNVAGVLLPGRRATLRAADEAFEALLAASRAPPESDERASLLAEVDALAQRNPVLLLMLPTGGRYLDTNEDVRTSRVEVLFAIALMAHRSEHGDDPASIDDLLGRAEMEPVRGRIGASEFTLVSREDGSVGIIKVRDILRRSGRPDEYLNVIPKWQPRSFDRDPTP